MNVLLWVLQVMLALHTATGAAWKVFNTEPSLKAIPHGLWLGLSAVEILCSVGLVFPAIRKSMGKVVPIAAGCIAAEMLLYCLVNVSSGVANYGHIVYWAVVAAVCGFVVYGRWVLRPI